MGNKNSIGHSIINPHAVRDPEITTKNRKPWGNPQPETGLMKDDNSLVKGIAKGKLLESKTVSKYNGNKLGNGFVAAHVWRELDESGTLSVRDHRLFAFAPNIFWVPGVFSKLTDIEGSDIQVLIQKLSIKIYKDIKVSDELRPFVDKCWDLLDWAIESRKGEYDLPEAEDITFFRLSDRSINLRINKILKLSNKLIQHAEGKPIDDVKISSKYDQYIPTINQEAAAHLGKWLQNYHKALSG